MLWGAGTAEDLREDLWEKFKTRCVSGHRADRSSCGFECRMGCSLDSRRMQSIHRTLDRGMMHIPPPIRLHTLRTFGLVPPSAFIFPLCCP